MLSPETLTKLSEIRKAMAAALRERPKNKTEYHRLGAEHRRILQAASPSIKAEWEACRAKAYS